ncbi:LysR family transcriptional regulator [Vibrio campbellii]
MNINVNVLRIFHSVVECGGFSAAAKSLELPVTNVSRRIIQLEEELNVSLFKRTTRVVVPTEAGEIFYQRTKSICSNLDSAIEELTSRHTALEGKIRIQLLPAAIPLLPYLNEFQTIHPNISLDLVVESQNIGLIENGIDLAIKVGDQNDSNLKCRKLLTMKRVIVASPDYLKSHTFPQSIQDIQDHNCLRFRDSDNKIESIWESADLETEKRQGNFVSNDISLIHQATLLGQGVALLPWIICEEDIKQGKLVQLLEKEYTFNTDIWLLYPNHQYQSSSLKTLIEFLVTSAVLVPTRSDTSI